MMLIRLLSLLILPMAAFAEDAAQDIARFNGHYQLVSQDGKEHFYDFAGPCHGEEVSQDGNVTNIDLTHYKCDNLKKKDVPLHSDYSTVDRRCPKDLYIKNSPDGYDKKETLIVLSDQPGEGGYVKLHDRNEDSSTCRQEGEFGPFRCLIENYVIAPHNTSWTYESESNRVSNSDSDYEKNSTQVSIEKDNNTLTLNIAGEESMFDSGANYVIVQGWYYVSYDYDFSCKYQLAH